jgi:hypothetical protein
VKSTTEATKPSQDHKAANEDRAEPTIIKLTRIKEWYIPVDAESYKTLQRAGCPMTRIHKDFLPTLKLLTSAHGIRARNVDFAEGIMNPFLDKVGKAWKSREHCDCVINKKTMVFESVKTEGFAIAKATIPKLEEKLREFFARWGYRHTFEYSELRGKCKLNVEYWFDPERQPIIVLEGKAEDKPKVQWRLGNLRLSFSFDNFESKTRALPDRPGATSESKPDLSYHIGYVYTLIEIRQGGTFTALHSSRCTYKELSSVAPLLKALMDVPNHNANNFDEEPD